MSLIAWYPLNNDFRNQGTLSEANNIIVKTEPSFSNNGKLGKGLTTGGFNWSAETTTKILKRHQFTMCMWVYTPTTSTGYGSDTSDEASTPGGNLLFGNDSRRRFSIFRFPTRNDFHWSWYTDVVEYPNVVTQGVIKGIFPNDTWTHIAIVYDCPNAYLYVNGKYNTQLCNNYNIDDITFDDTQVVPSRYNRMVNDYRFYDKALSATEIKEIAKGLMLHYSFENPYAEETTNIPHSITKSAYYTHITLGSDNVGNYFTKSTGAAWYEGIQINWVSVKPGRYYTWSMDLMPTKNTEYVIDNNVNCNNSSHNSNHNSNDDLDIIRGYSNLNHEVDGTDTLPKGKLEAYKWTRVYSTIKIRNDCSNPIIWSTFAPYIPSGDTEVKVYYRNSQLEEKIYDTPYTSSSRKAGLIRDNSGMGNDGTQVYQREEIPITPKTQTTSSSVPQYGGYTNVYDSNLKTYTINNFSGADNQTGMLGTIKYLSRYHYLNSKICYEFDIKLQDITVTDGKTIRILQQGPTVFKDDTCRWLSSPVQGVDITSRLNNGATGVYHVCIERIIDNTDCVTNADYYEFGLRFDYVKSGTVTVSNLHAYYGSLDTSTLSITDNSAVGTHSAYFNGKNYIDCGLVTPLEIDELTLSCWAYRDDWSTLPTGATWGSALISSVNSGGFGFKLEKCIQESIEKSINFVLFYKDAGYLEGVKSYGMAIDYTKLSSGWHLITGVATRNKATLYIDGEKVRECVHNLNKPIYNYDTTNKKRINLLVGAEPEVSTKPSAAIGVYIDDVRLYATALSDKDIKALYNVKSKIDNKSNLYCNQLVETKSENMMKPLNEVDLDNDLYKFYSNGTFSYKDGIMKYTISFSTPPSSDPHSGFYFSNSTYGGALKDNLAYRTSFYVRVSKAGTYLMGDERIGLITRTLEAGKWYKIVQEGLAIGKFANLIIYNCSRNLVAGDTIEARDVQIYRLYNDENYNPGPNIKGQYKTFELNETFNEDVENSGATVVDKYGAEWLEVFYHNTNNDTIYFTNGQEALHTNSQYKFSILDQLENFRGTDNKFEFLLEYPVDLPNQYNRWKQSDNPTKIIEVINNDTASTTFANGYEAIHIDWVGQYWGGLLRSSGDYTGSYIDGSVGHSNWHYAIGCCASWYGGIPGPKSGTSMGEVHLYVRIDNLPNKNEIFRQYKRQTKTKEIIEI